MLVWIDLIYYAFSDTYLLKINAIQPIFFKKVVKIQT